MSVLLGVLLGLGLVLAASPLLWPRVGPAPSLARPTLLDRLRDRLVRAGFERMPLSVFVLLSVIISFCSGALAQALVGVTAISAGACAVGFLLPYVVVGWRSRIVRQASRQAWPDVVDHLVSAVRSGLALPDSVASLAHTGPPALREAFAGFERSYRATGNFSLCIDELKTRLADPIADRILETLRMSREVGGSELTSVLRSLSTYLRQEAAIRSEVEGRQSWVMNAAKLGVAAPWLILVLLSTRPEAASAYNTASGAWLIVGGLVVSVVAYQVMIRLGRLPEERRWFQ